MTREISLLLVLPPQISCIGRNDPVRSIANVAVIIRLSSDAANGTLVDPTFAKVRFDIGAYFRGV